MSHHRIFSVTALRPQSLWHYAMPVLCVSLFAMGLVRSDTVIRYARAGISLWACFVLPVLLPFIILSKFWIYYQVPELLLACSRRIFPGKNALASTLPLMVLGLCAGYPIGAIFTRHFYENRIISKKTAENLLPLCSFVSPMFLLGYVHTLLSAEPGYTNGDWHIMLVCLYVPVIILYGIELVMGRLSSPRVAAMDKKMAGYNRSPASIDEIWTSSLHIIFTIGIYMMLFTVLFGLCENIWIPDMLRLPLQILMAGLEVTTGSQYIVSMAGISQVLRNALLLMVLQSGGLCTLAQISTILSSSGMTMKPYIRTKILCMVMSAGVYVIITKATA